jgi:superoxide dismutase, Fe-Mn family
MAKMTRRQVLQAAGVSAAAAALASLPRTARADLDRTYPYTLPKLPYEFDALVPHIDKQTMMIHHDRHHQTYVDGINAALKGQDDLQKLTLPDLLRNIAKVPMAIRQRVINHGGGHYNHSMFWEIMAPKAGGKPNGAIAAAIEKAFTSFDAFKKQFSQACADRFGSGWGWLVADKGRLAIISTANQDCPLMEGKYPILGLDVWEHAYYLNYQNRRPAYIDAWWNVVNWSAVNQRYAQAMKQ